MAKVENEIRAAKGAFFEQMLIMSIVLEPKRLIKVFTLTSRDKCKTTSNPKSWFRARLLPAKFDCF